MCAAMTSFDKLKTGVDGDLISVWRELLEGRQIVAHCRIHGCRSVLADVDAADACEGALAEACCHNSDTFDVAAILNRSQAARPMRFGKRSPSSSTALAGSLITRRTKPSRVAICNTASARPCARSASRLHSNGRAMR